MPVGDHVDLDPRDGRAVDQTADGDQHLAQNVDADRVIRRKRQVLRRPARTEGFGGDADRQAVPRIGHGAEIDVGMTDPLHGPRLAACGDHQISDRQALDSDLAPRSPKQRSGRETGRSARPSDVTAVNAVEGAVRRHARAVREIRAALVGQQVEGGGRRSAPARAGSANRKVARRRFARRQICSGKFVSVAAGREGQRRRRAGHAVGEVVDAGDAPAGRCTDKRQVNRIHASTTRRRRRSHSRFQGASWSRWPTPLTAPHPLGAHHIDRGFS